MSDFDDRMMRRALDLALRGRGRVEPNPVVGAVLVQGDAIVGEGHHQFFGGPHAEVNAIQAAGEQTVGATMYVTLEPCCHYGKTPPCTDAVILAGIKRVHVAMQDPFPMVSGHGLAKLRAAGIEVHVGLCEKEAMHLNAPYLKLHRCGLPYFIAKWAMTLDGRIATVTGDSRWISSPKSREIVHHLRDRADAVMVGIDTVLRDDPLLTCRLPGARSPRRIVVDTHARLPLASKLVTSIPESDVWVVCGRSAKKKATDALAGAGCRVLTVEESGGRMDLAALAKLLGDEMLTNVVVEGGPRLFGSLFAAKLVDHVMVFVAPKLVGGERGHNAIAGPGVRLMSEAWTLTHVTVTTVDHDALVEGDVDYGEER
jgi:diaminohydroxyphosphoribosylaminopyrimidine deaminase/5-amino-6-(5-phosphoribosylamino)uracil reductase